MKCIDIEKHLDAIKDIMKDVEVIDYGWCDGAHTIDYVDEDGDIYCLYWGQDPGDSHINRMTWDGCYDPDAEQCECCEDEEVA